MSARRILLGLAVVLLVAAPALAADKIAPRVDPGARPRGFCPSQAYAGRGVCEGFENGVPPPGWTAGITDPGYTWHPCDAWLEGVYAARIYWQAASPQNETLTFSAAIDVAGGESVLSFYIAGAAGDAWAYPWILHVAETVEIFPGFCSYSGDCTTAHNDYPLVGAACTGYTASGKDVVWATCREVGDEISIDLFGAEGSDPAIFLVRDCTRPGDTCVAGTDANKITPSSWTTRLWRTAGISSSSVRTTPRATLYSSRQC